MVNIPLFTWFYTSQVVQDFFHQQYSIAMLAYQRVTAFWRFTTSPAGIPPPSPRSSTLTGPWLLRRWYFSMTYSSFLFTSIQFRDLSFPIFFFKNESSLFGFYLKMTFLLLFLFRILGERCFFFSGIPYNPPNSIIATASLLIRWVTDVVVSRKSKAQQVMKMMMSMIRWAVIKGGWLGHKRDELLPSYIPGLYFS